MSVVVGGMQWPEVIRFRIYFGGEWLGHNASDAGSGGK